MSSGDGVTHIVPVYEGFAVPHAITRVDVAGRDVTEHLQLLMRRGGRSFCTSSEKEAVRTIKEEQCYVAYEAASEEESWEALPTADKFEDCVLPDGTKRACISLDGVKGVGSSRFGWITMVASDGGTTSSTKKIS